MFANKLKTARKAAGLTLEKLAENYNDIFDTGLSKGTLSKYENGKQEPMITTVKNLASVLNVSADYLLSDGEENINNDKFINNDEELTEYLEELKNRPELKMMFQLAKGASKEDVEKAVKIIEAFLKE